MCGGLVLAAPGCNNEPDVFVCSSPDQCNGGICQPTGYCSFPDPTCSSGQRYGRLAGDGLANDCVSQNTPDDEGEVGSESETSSTTSSSTTITGSSSSSSSEGSTSSTSSNSSTSKGSSDATSSSTADTSSSDADGSSSDSSTVTTAEPAESSSSTTEDSAGDTGPIISCQPDHFDGTSSNPGSLWNRGGGLPSTHAMVADGQLHLIIDPTTTDSIVVSTRSAISRYDGTIELELGSVETAAEVPGAQLVFGVGRTIAATGLPNGLPEFLEFQISGFDLVTRYSEADPDPESETGYRFVVVGTPQPYEAALHRHLRFRIEGAGDDAIFYWESSGDGIEWDILAELPKPEDAFDMSAAIVQILAGTYEESDETSPDPFTIEFYEQCREIR